MPSPDPAPDVGPPASGEAGGGRDYAVVLAEAERVLDDVERALTRLDDGSYGTCEVCGAPIGDQVLGATPTARTCESHLPLAGPA
jgi:hypothetical protein